LDIFGSETSTDDGHILKCTPQNVHHMYTTNKCLRKLPTLTLTLTLTLPYRPVHWTRADWDAPRDLVWIYFSLLIILLS